MDYLDTFPNRKIICVKSDMELWVHRDGAYLIEPKARRRAGGFFFLSGVLNDAEKRIPKLNGPTHVLCEILKNVFSSAAES